MLLLDKTGKRQTVTETHLGRNVRHTEHYDGTVDAEVKVSAIKMSITNGAPPDPQLVQAIAELESATREWRMAKHSESSEWKRYAKARLAVANERVVEVQ